MNVVELHIGVDIGTQGIRSAINDGRTPEEVDRILNEVRDNYIIEKLDTFSNPRGLKHQQTKKRITDLESLINIRTLFSFQGDTNESSFTLPGNYLEDINISVRTSCDTKKTQIDNNFYINIFKINDSLDNLFKDFKIRMFKNNNWIELFNLSNFSSYSEGFNENDEKFYLIQLIKDSLYKFYKTEDIDIYWEDFRDNYYNNSFIIVSRTKFDKIEVTDENIVITDTQIITNKVYNLNTPYVKCRIVEEEDIDEFHNNEFCKSKVSSPICVIKQGNIVIYTNNFIVGDVKIEYYKKPRNINYKIQQNCEITQKRGQEIINRVVEKITARTGSEIYNVLKQENQILNNN